jgi:hypothetical protein
MKTISYVILLGMVGLLPRGAEALEWDSSKYSQTVTDCDLQASHSDDPLSVAPGKSSSQINFTTAIASCQLALEQDPSNPRLHYQLARVYGYSGQGEKAYPHRAAAVAADYPQALFVNGYLHLKGLNKAPIDLCRAGELIRRAAQYGRLAGQVGFPRFALQGLFEGCDVPVDATEMLGFLSAAAATTSDFYKSTLVEMLVQDVQAQWPSGD